MGVTDSRSVSRIVLVDDQRVFTDALALALSMTGDLRVVAADTNVEDGLRSIEAAHPELIVCDYRLSGRLTGIDLAKRVREAESADPDRTTTPIVILTAFPAPTVARQAVRLESVQVMSKQSSVADIVSALRRSLLGLRAEPVIMHDPFSLSPAELEVLELLSAGLTATTIAEALCLSVHAIRARIRGILTKTGSTSQLEAVAKATSAGIVVPPSVFEHAPIAAIA